MRGYDKIVNTFAKFFNQNELDKVIDEKVD